MKISYEMTFRNYKNSNLNETFEHLCIEIKTIYLNLKKDNCHAVNAIRNLYYNNDYQYQICLQI